MLSCFVGIVSLFRPALGLGTHLPLIISGQNDGILVLGHGVLGSRQEGVMERWLTCRVVEGTSEKLNFNLKKGDVAHRMLFKREQWGREKRMLTWFGRWFYSKGHVTRKGTLGHVTVT